jgi:hypothetical protein
MARNVPNGVGMSASAIRCTSRSERRRQAIRSAMVMIVRSCSAASSSSSGSRAMSVFFWSTTSQSTPAGARPARRARSTAASVWPARFSTPPGLASSGTTWPGRDRSLGRVAGSISAVMVRARSWAEMPVVVPCTASTVTR